MPGERFGMLRRVLRMVGLSQQSTDSVVDFISDLLTDEGKAQDAAEIRGNQPESPPIYPYHLRSPFLSAAELRFLEVLRVVVGAETTILCKVALSDIFWVKHPEHSQFRIYTNKIDRKHVDFVLCRTATMQPLMGIELDDKSHQRKDRQERDVFVDEVFRAAHLPLLHVPVQPSYANSELRRLIDASMAGQPTKPTMPQAAPPPLQQAATRLPPAPPLQQAAPQPPSSDVPLCPRCGKPMVLRTSRKGDNAGGQFWGCTGYPHCKAMLPYEGR